MRGRELLIKCHEHLFKQSCSPLLSRVDKGRGIARLWELGLHEYEGLKGIDWSWLAMDGAMTKAPLGGRGHRAQSDGPRQRRDQTQCADRCERHPVGTSGGAGANRDDFKLARQTLESVPVGRPTPTETAPQGMCLDKGYDFDGVRDLLREFGFTAHIRTRGEEAQALLQEAGFKARRWVVERTHSWLNRFRTFSSAGRKSRRITLLCCISRLPTSLCSKRPIGIGS
jgi:transposase